MGLIRVVVKVMALVAKAIDSGLPQMCTTVDEQKV